MGISGEIRGKNLRSAGGCRAETQVPKGEAPGAPGPGAPAGCPAETQVPKCEALGHPDSVVVITSPGTWDTRHLGQPAGCRAETPVPKGEAPGAPRFSGCDHFPRHLGHPAPGAPADCRAETQVPKCEAPGAPGIRRVIGQIPGPQAAGPIARGGTILPTFQSCGNRCHGSERRSHDSAALVRTCIGAHDSDHALLGLLGQRAQDRQGLAL